jgi:hypothetical protein
VLRRSGYDQDRQPEFGDDYAKSARERYLNTTFAGHRKRAVDRLPTSPSRTRSSGLLSDAISPRAWYSPRWRLRRNFNFRPSARRKLDRRGRRKASKPILARAVSSPPERLAGDNRRGSCLCRGTPLAISRYPVCATSCDSKNRTDNAPFPPQGVGLLPARLVARTLAAALSYCLPAMVVAC